MASHRPVCPASDIDPPHGELVPSFKEYPMTDPMTDPIKKGKGGGERSWEYKQGSGDRTIEGEFGPGKGFLKI